MKIALLGFIGVLLSAELAAAQATPNIPPGDLPGRERQRFQESPLDRFTDPLAEPRNTEPLWRWQCDNRPKSHRRGKRHKRSRGC